MFSINLLVSRGLSLFHYTRNIYKVDGLAWKSVFDFLIVMFSAVNKILMSRDSDKGGFRESDMSSDEDWVEEQCEDEHLSAIKYNYIIT